MTLLRVSRRLSAWLAYCWNPTSITDQKSDLLKDEPARVTARWIAKYDETKTLRALGESQYGAPCNTRRPTTKGL